MLRTLGVDDTACQAALADAEWPARIQRLQGGTLAALLPHDCELWLDGGHNAAAGEALAAVLDDWRAQRPLPVRAIVGMLQTKAAIDFLRPLAPRVAGMKTVAIPGMDATFSAAELADMADSLGVPATPSPTIRDALVATAKDLDGPMRVLICGSLYLAGEVLKADMAPAEAAKTT